jgi:hypothetical protein
VRELIIYKAKGHFVSLMVLRTLKAFGAKLAGQEVLSIIHCQLSIA